MLAPRQLFLKIFILDTSRYIKKLGFLYKGSTRFHFIFLDLSRSFLTFHLHKLSFLTQNLFLTKSLASRVISSFGMISFLTLFHAFHPFDLTFGIFFFFLIFINFGVFQNYGGFCEIFRMGFCLNEFKSSCIASHVHFNYDSCILDL